MQKKNQVKPRFTESQKKIFKYWDGSKTRGIDPLDVAIALNKQDFDWQATALRAKTGDIAAVGELLDYARRVFNLKEFEEVEGKSEGITGEEVLNVLVNFIEYLDQLQNFTEGTATSTPSMAVPQT